MPRPALANVSIAAIQAELQRRVAKLEQLKAERDALDRQIAELEGQAAAKPEAGKKPGPKLGREPGRKPAAKTKAARAAGKPLAEYIKEVLAAAPAGLKVREIDQAVREAGYPTSAKDLYVPIMKALPKAGATRVAPGTYCLGGGKVAEKAAKDAGKPATRKAAKELQQAAAAPEPATAAPAHEETKPPTKRQKHAQTGEGFILGLFEADKTLTVGEIADAWTKDARRGMAETYLTKLVEEGKLKRKSVEGRRRSRYSLA